MLFRSAGNYSPWLDSSGNIHGNATFEPAQPEQRPGRKLGEFLVVGDLEGVGALAGGKAAAPRDRPPLNIEPAEKEPPAGVRRGQDLAEIAPVRLRARHRAAVAPLPPARLEPQEIVDPGADVVVRRERDMRETFQAPLVPRGLAAKPGRNRGAVLAQQPALVATVHDALRAARRQPPGKRAVERLARHQVPE